MSKLWTDLDNPSLTDDYVSPTSDVLLDEFEELQLGSYTSWRTNDLFELPILVAENVTAFEDADLLEPPPLIPDERTPRYSQPFFVISGLSEKSKRFFTYRVARTVTSPHILVHAGVEQHHYTRFSPDFFNIKKFVTYVMSRTSASPIDQKQLSKTKLTIPTTVSPQVIIESEEKKLTKDLETAVRIAEENYSTLKAIDVNIEHDPEIVDRKTIQFALTVSGESDLVLKDEFKFKEKLYSALDIKTCEQITTTYKWKS